MNERERKVYDALRSVGMIDGEGYYTVYVTKPKIEPEPISHFTLPKEFSTRPCAVSPTIEEAPKWAEEN